MITKVKEFYRILKNIYQAKHMMKITQNSFNSIVKILSNEGDE